MRYAVFELLINKGVITVGEYETYQTIGKNKIAIVAL
jgi:hypothetical protein